MRRADRLFQIVLCLRRRRAVTADQMAAELEVSPRTIYRDIRDLMVNGVPIDGEAEIVRGWADPDLARAARTAFEGIEAVLSERLRTMQGPGRFMYRTFSFARRRRIFWAICAERSTLSTRYGSTIREPMGKLRSGRWNRWAFSFEAIVGHWALGATCVERTARFEWTRSKACWRCRNFGWFMTRTDTLRP